MTTRNKRPGEIDGKDYFFVTKSEFEQAIKENKLLEYATYVNNYYGTPKDFVEKVRNNNQNIFLEIEPQGAIQVINQAKKNHDQKLLSIFIAPPSLEDLKKRLLERSTEPIEIVNQRINTAK